MLNYWFAVLARTIGDSLEIVGHTHITIAYGLAVLAIPAFRILRKGGWGMFKEHLAREVATTIGFAVIAWVPFFLWFLFATPYRMQLDSTQKVNDATNEKIQTGNQLISCKAELRGATEKTGFLEKMSGTQQSNINAQQTTLTAQQQTLNSQQGTTNNCVIALGKANTPEPQRTTTAFVQIENTLKAAHRTMMFVFTNHPIPPRLGAWLRVNILLKKLISVLWERLRTYRAGD